jgi:hypothetical protein
VNSLWKILGGAVLLALWGVAPALADTASSSNWSGYAIHRAGVRFARVSATWIQPSAVCSRGNPTFSAIWVGLGGFAESANALEQIGTEVDCTASGRVSAGAWYEVVPSPSHSIRMPVHAGDAMAAAVTVIGHRVLLSLTDLTERRAFRRTLTADAVDVSSAEWIVEAPSACTGPDSCHALPLADFGSASFRLARVKTAGGHVGAISDRAWRTTKIRLAPGARRYVAYGGSLTAGTASPTGLSAGGTAFSVRFSPLSVPSNPLAATGAAIRAGTLVHPTR